jgi:hypothetical protein
METDFPLFVFFSPPELVSAPRTGSSVNKIWPFQKKKLFFLDLINVQDKSFTILMIVPSLISCRQKNKLFMNL